MLSVPLFYRPFHFAFRLFFFDGVPFIKGFFALCEADKHFCLAADKIYLERDESEALHCDLADKLSDLFAV